jgi:hypothetical protein
VKMPARSAWRTAEMGLKKPVQGIRKAAMK